MGIFAFFLPSDPVEPLTRELASDLDGALDAFRVAIEPSILEREQMEIDAKRDRLNTDIENFEAAAEYHEKQAAIYRQKSADTKRIHEGLRQHEAIVGAKSVEGLVAAGAEVEATRLETDEYDPADDARKSYDGAVEAKQKRGDKHWPKRASEKQLQAAE